LYGKPHVDFNEFDLAAGWETPSGYPRGITRKILASDIDETKKAGSRTQLLRFGKGVFTTEPFVHEYMEEVFLIEGDLSVGSDEAGTHGDGTFTAPAYASRPPGTVHGPFKSQLGCLLLEFHYFVEKP
jgi:hypothetical protein